MLKILVIDDDTDVRTFVAAELLREGYRVVQAVDGEDGLARLDAAEFDVVLCDIRLPGLDGLTVFRRAHRLYPHLDIVLMTSFGEVADAVAALKEGATDYLTKPFDIDELKFRVAGIASRAAVRRELAEAREKLWDDGGRAIVGASPVIAKLRERIAMVAPSPAPIVITGESGTGKELVARAIHANSPRRAGPFVAVNCAAFPETLLEAELFGHERGAFTGATRRREGRFKAAHGGTLLLDELAEIPLSAQAKLLRVLQEGIVEPLGTDVPLRVDVRIVSATNRDLKARIAEGLFREDLYYRLNAVTIVVPPLRDRRGDLPLLLHHFLRQTIPPERSLPELSMQAWAALNAYAFPGNVRELAHAVQHAALLCGDGPIELEHLPDDIIGGTASISPEEASLRPLNHALKRFEREYLLRALSAADGKRVRAAELLGISRKNLWEKLRAHGITDSDLDD